jgi:ABC-2 type transport system permease protein
MHPSLQIAAKDLRQRVRDRSVLLVGIVAPFALAALFGSILGGVEDDFSARWAIVDLDGGSIAQGFDDGPIAAMEDSGILATQRLPDAEAAREAVEDGRVDAAIIIPAGFSGDVLAGSGRRSPARSPARS